MPQVIVGFSMFVTVDSTPLFCKHIEIPKKPNHHLIEFVAIELVIAIALLYKLMLGQTEKATRF